MTDRPRKERRSVGSRVAWFFRAKISYGLSLPAFLRLLTANRFALALPRAPVALLSAYLAVFNTGLAVISWFVFSTKLRETELQHDPLFVLGHWRSGTTYLHELISCDERFAAPNGYQCFVPAHFLISESTLKPVAQLFLPRSRPMDAMVLDLDRPQEDDFAMLGLIGHSTAGWFLFPGTSDGDRPYLSLRNLTADARDKWTKTWLTFLKSVSLRSGLDRRLLLKSPQHTARVRAILEVFPEAKFVHIARNPHDVFLSTLRTWRAMADEFGLQIDRNEEAHVAELILQNFSEMYRCYGEDRQLIRDRHLVEVKYEDLATDPIGAIGQIYEELGLGGLDGFKDKLEERTKERAQGTGRAPLLSDSAGNALESEFALYRDLFDYPIRPAG